ncbi:hypothetical protein LIER_30619 [Lithospermum erythrorhizon]|uniref:Protein kinase domain-containing protein n=1 Tax=Lithospermum erythrorhizon TaxID=34254 RepID=A0AAV3RSA9_LITER
MLSPSSSQGYKEFESEATLLLTIHHKNLTSLVGYCYEGSNMGILYEYMANGNLEKHLLGKGPYVLPWEERLRMATDAAQGLEYLHHGCKPLVVHRDVKITNILVDENFRAKLADFGLSRAFPNDEDGTHVGTTVVAGTPGYLDPEYYETSRLTEKSDIYSFGIVLLEIVTGRPAIQRNNEPTHIITWVTSEIVKGDLSNIVDPKLQGDYDINSIWKVLEVAMSCVARKSTRRPTMNFVVIELNACLTMEMTRNGTKSK